MAGDNILALIMGVLDQSQKSADLLIQDALLRRRSKETQENEMALYPRKLALQTEAKRAESGIDLERQKGLETFKYETQLPLEREKLESQKSRRDVLDVDRDENRRLRRSQSVRDWADKLENNYQLGIVCFLLLMKVHVVYSWRLPYFFYFYFLHIF